MVGCSPCSEEHDDGLAVIGYVDDFLGLDGDVVERLEYLITPVADPLVAVKGASNREISGVPDLGSLVTKAERRHPVLLKPSHQRRTISTFSCDIAYSDSPAALRASLSAKNIPTLITCPSLISPS